MLLPMGDVEERHVGKCPCCELSDLTKSIRSFGEASLVGCLLAAAQWRWSAAPLKRVSGQTTSSDLFLEPIRRMQACTRHQYNSTKRVRCTSDSPVVHAAGKNPPDEPYDRLGRDAGLSTRNETTCTATATTLVTRTGSTTRSPAAEGVLLWQ